MHDSDPAGVDPILEAEELRESGLERVLGGGRIVLELGFGRGELLLDLAEQNPGACFLGVEVSRKRVVKAGRRARRRRLSNLRLVHAPAEYLVERALPPGSVAECWINCPDPWPKRRHFRRRMIQPGFVEKLVPLLEPGAVVHLATDHPGYASWIADVLAEAEGVENLHAPAPWSEAPPPRRVTAYERDWIEDGRRMAYFEYRRSE